MGKYADVWKGKLSRKGDNNTRINVCHKAMKIGKVHKVSNLSSLCPGELLVDAYQELYREVVTWAKLKHPNILQCFGITLDPLQIMTEWMPNGHVMQYLREHCDVDRVRLVSCHLFSVKVIVIECPSRC